jgi:hypothetical protein
MPYALWVMVWFTRINTRLAQVAISIYHFIMAEKNSLFPFLGLLLPWLLTSIQHVEER